MEPQQEVCSNITQLRPEIRRICSRIARARRELTVLRQATSALKDDYSTLESDVIKLSPEVKSVSEETGELLRETEVDNYFSTILRELEDYGKRIKLGVFYTRDLNRYCHPGPVKCGPEVASQSLLLNISSLNDTLTDRDQTESLLSKSCVELS